MAIYCSGDANKARHSNDLWILEILKFISNSHPLDTIYNNNNIQIFNLLIETSADDDDSNLSPCHLHLDPNQQKDEISWWRGPEASRRNGQEKSAQEEDGDKPSSTGEIQQLAAISNEFLLFRNWPSQTQLSSLWRCFWCERDFQQQQHDLKKK